MVIQELKPSKRVRGRWLAVLEDGSLLRVGEGEVIQFALCAGRELTEEEAERLQAAVRTGGLKEKALNLLAGRPMSRRELERKLESWEAAPEEATAICGRLEELGFLNDALYAEQVVRHYSAKGYGLRKLRDELYRRGVPRELWDEALERAEDPAEAIDAFLAKKLGKWKSLEQSGQIPYTVLTTAGAYLDWVLMTAPEDSELFDVKEIAVEALVGETVARKLQKHISREALLSLPLDQVYDEELAAELEHHLTYEYEHLADVGLHTKATVSELKRAGQPVEEFSEEEQPVDLFAQWKSTGQQEQPEKQIMERAVRRGTAYHRVLELLDFTTAVSLKDVQNQIQEMVTSGKISEENARMVRPGEIWKFVQTKTGKRMTRAQSKRQSHREQQFVMGVPAREMHMGDSDELVLIQGIIDVWLEEEDGMVLIDYKTDHVSDGEILVKRYKVQLDYYQRALEQMTGKRVKERIIYSLALQKEILC